ncbi:MAG: MotA/TolQ/ExbB proton channel family protein, partial [Desulfamplus sp.]|nr:MotA/TolQ/ExbB proton channel family protein [Desulfamplus sp.]
MSNFNFVIESVLQSKGLTHSFVILIILVLIIGLILRFFTRPNNRFVALLPNIATSLGILGTFIGIYAGLLEFDVKNINDSIPQLLEGLKTAFATSIAGMIASIILRFLFEGKTTYEESKENKGLSQTDDPILLLKNIASGIDNLDKSSKEIEKSIVSCFRSDEEFSLISQLKLIRQEIIDTRRELNASFKEFAKEMGRINSDALVEALKKVIDDFNVLLNELVS